MIVNVIFLDYLRHDFTERVRAQNLSNAGYPFGLTVINRKGIAAAINQGIQMSEGCNAIVTMANDILMPDNWLKEMVNAANLIPNTGMCGIHCVEGLGNTETINGVTVHPSFTAFGNVLIPMSVIRKVGYFNEDYDPYGMQDADFAYRLNKTGHINYYLHGMKSEHIGHDVGLQNDYRRMKDEGLAAAGDKWDKWTKYYDETENYIIDLKEWPDTK